MAFLQGLATAEQPTAVNLGLLKFDDILLFQSAVQALGYDPEDKSGAEDVSQCIPSGINCVWAPHGVARVIGASILGIVSDSCIKREPPAPGTARGRAIVLPFCIS